MTNSAKKRPGKSSVAANSPTTKKGQLIELLGNKTGADIKSLSETLGWQQHTTRAALTGLRKAGYEIAGEKAANGGLSKYRILSVPAAQEGSAAVGTAHGA